MAAEVIKSHVKDNEVDQIISRLDKADVRALGIASISKHFGTDFRKEFSELDSDGSGNISHPEFRRYIMQVVQDQLVHDAPAPSTRQLILFSLNSAIPFVVFGFLDNSIMIIGGEVVDDVIGSVFKLSTLACAALANTFADVLGISIGNSVETLTAKLGVPQAQLSHSQTQLPRVRRIGLASGSAGIFVGCILGMAPLLFIDSDKDKD